MEYIKKAWIVNVLVIILVIIVIVIILLNYSKPAKPENYYCKDNSPKLKTSACWYSSSGTVIAKIERGADYSVISEMSFILQNDKTIGISEIPKINETKKYRVSSSEYPKEIILSISTKTENESEFCSYEKIVTVEKCAEETSIQANTSSGETGEKYTESIIDIGGKDLLSKELVKERKIFGDSCKSEWECSKWEDCVNNIQKRDCKDKKLCLIPSEMPDFTRRCNQSCAENWQCTWSACKNGYTAPDCRDLSNCKTEYSKPEKLKCINEKTGCMPDVICGNWSICSLTYRLSDLTSRATEKITGSKSRVCRDKNSCISPVTDKINCSTRVDILLEETIICNETYLEVYDKLEGNLLSTVKYSKENESMDINLLMSDATPKKCPYCSNGMKDGDEIGIDCGGSCSPCQKITSSRSLLSDIADFFRNLI